MATTIIQDRIPFRIHPRVFAALGADLVTNDVGVGPSAETMS